MSSSVTVKGSSPLSNFGIAGDDHPNWSPRPKVAKHAESKAILILQDTTIAQ